MPISIYCKHGKSYKINEKEKIYDCAKKTLRIYFWACRSYTVKINLQQNDLNLNQMQIVHLMKKN